MSYTNSDLAFKLAAINFAEGGDNSENFYACIEMPDKRTALEWINERPGLAEEMLMVRTGRGEKGKQ